MHCILLSFSISPLPLYFISMKQVYDILQKLYIKEFLRIENKHSNVCEKTLRKKVIDSNSFNYDSQHVRHILSIYSSIYLPNLSTYLSIFEFPQSQALAIFLHIRKIYLEQIINQWNTNTRCQNQGSSHHTYTHTQTHFHTHTKLHTHTFIHTSNLHTEIIYVEKKKY